MNTITAKSRAGTGRILAISISIQLLFLSAFYFIEPLRKSMLSGGEDKVREADEQAARRFEELEKNKNQQKAEQSIPEDQAQRMLKEKQQREEPKIKEHLASMKDIRESLRQMAQQKTEELQHRTLQEASIDLFDQLHILATGLVAGAINQSRELKVAGVKNVEQASTRFLATLESHKEQLIASNSFAALRQAHQGIQEHQHHVIIQLDEVQAAYSNDQERIRRENHIEYLVNLKRDQIADILQQIIPLDPATMNDQPMDAIIPDTELARTGESSAAPDMQSMYDEAVQLYEDIRQSFSVARAAEMAMQQNVSMQQAWNGINLPPPPPGYTGLKTGGAPGTIGALNEATAAIDAARRAIEQLWQSAQGMSSAASTMTGGTPAQAGGTGKAAAFPGGAGSRARASGLAAGRSGRFADMTSFQYVGGGMGEKGFSGGTGGGQDVTEQSIRSGYRETGPGTPGAREALLSEERVLAQALPGRMFNRGSERTGWLYIDTWYIIGPWENKGITTFKETHPPETLVDLDAEYTGKNQRSIRWQFHQSDNIRIKPPVEMESSTYYGYTEVFFEEETEMLVAVASDDAARVWLNDLMIWEDHGNSPWRLDEGFRNVVFRKGFNTLLVRIENGPIACTFSILLCPPGVVAGR